MDDIATFADNTGLVIKDGGLKISDLLPIAGGTMTGTLTLAGNPTNANDAANKAYVDATAGTAVQSVSGTANRITSTGGVNPVIDISTSYVGQATITTLGTITSGTWNGTAIALSNGGTNANLTSSNGGIFYSTATAGAILSGTATANKVLMSGSSAAPVWSTPTYPNASVTAGKVIISDGTNYIASTPTYPNSSATTGKILISDGTNFVASTPTYPNTSGTAGKVVISDGTNNVYSTPTFPNASATSGKIIKSDGTNWTASTETYASPSTSGNVMTSDGTNWTSAASFRPNAIYNLKDDFFSPNFNSITATFMWSEIPWVNTGSGLQYVAASETAHPGVIGNASTTTRAGILTTAGSTSGTTATPILLGGGVVTINWVIKIATTSTVTNRYTLYCGLLDLNSAEANNGVYLVYSDNLNSGKWVGRTAAGGSRNDVNDTGSAVTTAWYNLGCTINAAASSVEFFVNGVSLGTQASTIPTANPIGISANLIRSAGTVAANSVLVDLMYFTFTETTPR